MVPATTQIEIGSIGGLVRVFSDQESIGFASVVPLLAVRQ